MRKLVGFCNSAGRRRDRRNYLRSLISVRPYRRFGGALGPDAIEAHADALSARAAVRLIDETDRASFLDVLRTRLDMTWLVLEAAAAVLQFGARGDVSGAEAARRLREAQFVAILTPSVKHITTELARG